LLNGPIPEETLRVKQILKINNQLKQLTKNFSTSNLGRRVSAQVLGTKYDQSILILYFTNKIKNQLECIFFPKHHKMMIATYETEYFLKTDLTDFAVYHGNTWVWFYLSF